MDPKFIMLPKDLIVMGNVGIQLTEKNVYILLAALTQTIERFK